MTTKIEKIVWRLKKSPKSVIGKTIWDLWQFINGSPISWYATFGSVPCFPHGTKGVFISGGAAVGKNCVIFQQVTIGSNTLIDSAGVGVPIVGDNCYIGAGAKIIGNVKVGDNVRISANAVVYKDVPSDSTVLAGEMKIIEKKQLDNRFYNFPGSWMCYDRGEFRPVLDGRLEKLRRIKL